MRISQGGSIPGGFPPGPGRLDGRRSFGLSTEFSFQITEGVIFPLISRSLVSGVTEKRENLFGNGGNRMALLHKDPDRGGPKDNGVAGVKVSGTTANEGSA